MGNEYYINNCITHNMYVYMNNFSLIVKNKFYYEFYTVAC